MACCVKCQRRGQREPNCDGARSNCNVVCVDCTWPCATLVAVTMCGTAEATKDHLNEHSLCYSSQLGSQAPSRDRSTRAESGLCRVSVVCQLWQYYATQPHGTRGRVLTGLSEAASTPLAKLVGDEQCSMWPMTRWSHVVHVLAMQARRLLSCLLATRCCSPAVVCDAEGRHERRTRFRGECRKWKVVCTAHDLCCPRRRRHAAASSPPSCSFAAFAAAGTRSVFARFCCCSSSDSWDEELIWLRKAANPSMKVSATLLRRLICKKCFRHFFSTSVVCEPRKSRK